MAQSPTKVSEIVLGGVGGEYMETSNCVIPATGGGFIIGAVSSSPISGTKSQNEYGGGDFWVSKMNSDGSKQWDYRFGGNGWDGLKEIIPASDGGYVLGGVTDSGAFGDVTQNSRGSYDYWIVKISEMGIKQWDARFGGDNMDLMETLKPSPDGGYLIGGRSYSGISGDKSAPYIYSADYWVIKVNSQGVKLWDKTYSGGGNVSAYGQDHLNYIQPTIDGGFLLGGFSSSSAGFDKSSELKGGSDWWIIKINADGTKLWDASYGGGDHEVLFAIQPIASGGYLLAGTTYSSLSGDVTQHSRGGSDYWVVKINELGVKQWDARFGGDQDDFLWTIRPTSDKGFLLGGSSSSGASGDKSQGSFGLKDYWIVKIDGDGSKEWDVSFGGSEDDELKSIQKVSYNEYLLAGSSSSSVSGNKAQDAFGGGDIWIVKIRDESALPVTLLNFNAKPEANKVLINWQTAQELNALHFTMERSKDMKGFEQIGVVPAAGNANETSTYTYTDETPLKGRSYYRLRQVDQDGKSTTYRAISVRISGTDSPYPNPSKGGVFQIETADMAGLKLFTEAGIEVPIGYRRVSAEAVEITPKERLVKGIYLIRSDGVGYKLVVE
ncbi:hypothetical protein [Dyadobacter jejuensis]|nr:hypothetical protein [Dyadobacter jejuensis]